MQGYAKEEMRCVFEVCRCPKWARRASYCWCKSERKVIVQLTVVGNWIKGISFGNIHDSQGGIRAHFSFINI